MGICRVLCTEGAQQTSPGQSAAPPWVRKIARRLALKERNKVPCFTLSELSDTVIAKPRAALRSALGCFVAAPLMLRQRNLGTCSVANAISLTNEIWQ